jgi:hypothetical protein
MWVATFESITCVLMIYDFSKEVISDHKVGQSLSLFYILSPRPSNRSTTVTSSSKLH